MMQASGDWVRKRRKAAGLTQGQLAALIGMSQGFIGELERGEKQLEERTKRLIDHYTGPYQFLTSWTVSDDLAERAKELIDEVAAACPDGDVGGIVRLRDGTLMIGVRKRTSAVDSDP